MLGVICFCIAMAVIGGFKFVVGGIFTLVILKWLVSELTRPAKINVGKGR